MTGQKAEHTDTEQNIHQKTTNDLSNQETDIDSPRLNNSRQNVGQNNQTKNTEQNQQVIKQPNENEERKEIERSEEVNFVPQDFQIKKESPLSNLEKQIRNQKGKDIVKQVGKYALRQKLGVGAFGKVYLSTYMDLMDPIQFFAIKEMPLRSGPTSKIVRCLLTKREINNMIRVQHVNIVSLIDVVFTSNNCYLVMEYCEGGNLKDYVKNNNGIISEHNALYFTQQLAEGLKALNQSFIIHRDIKPENLLLSNSGNSPILKICDLGFSKNIKDESEGKTKCGTQQYMAHEILKGKQKYNYKVDLWSVGIILYELITGGLTPFPGISDYQVVCNQLIGPNMNKLNCSEQCKNFIGNLLQCQDSKRMSFQEFYTHPWLRQISIEQLQNDSEILKAHYQIKQDEIDTQEAISNIHKAIQTTQQILDQIESIQSPNENNFKVCAYLLASFIVKQQKDQYEAFKKHDQKISRNIKDLDSLQDRCGELISFCREQQLAEESGSFVHDIQEIAIELQQHFKNQMEHINETQLRHLVESALSYIGTIPVAPVSEYWQEQGYWLDQEEVDQSLSTQPQESVMDPVKDNSKSEDIEWE